MSYYREPKAHGEPMFKAAGVAAFALVMWLLLWALDNDCAQQDCGPYQSPHLVPAGDGYLVCACGPRER